MMIFAFKSKLKNLLKNNLGIKRIFYLKHLLMLIKLILHSKKQIITLNKIPTK